MQRREENIMGTSMRKLGSFVLLLAAGMLVFSLGGYWADLPHAFRSIVKTTLPILLLLTTWACGRVEALRPWRGVSLALLAASCGFCASWWLGGPVLKAMGVTPDSVPGVALAKLSDALLIVIPVILVARAGGVTPAELYLGRGRWRAWLSVGLGAFAVFLALFVLQVRGLDLTTAQLLKLAPWTLLFIFANAFMEELHFRGLLLAPFERLIGRHAANVCIALFFTLVHAPVQYTSDVAVFLAVVFPLALAWGYLIQRTGALWGAVLFHAGADLLIMVGVYTTFGVR